MPTTDYTTNRNIPYPTGADLIPEGPAQMEAIANALDGENRGEIDFLQPGVVKSTDWNFTAGMESGSECKLDSESEVAESVAWLPLTAIGLVRSVTPKQKLKGLKPPSLPGAGKYMSVGIELSPSTSDGAATASIVSGVEKGTQAQAEAAPAGEVAGKLRIRNVIILNTAGTYSIVAQSDARPWATGTGEKYTEVLVAESGKEIEPSSIRPANVILCGYSGQKFTELFVGGVKIAEWTTENAPGTVSFTCNPGQKFKAITTGGETYGYSWLLL